MALDVGRDRFDVGDLDDPLRDGDTPEGSIGWRPQQRVAVRAST
jgi:hypothetical protein